MNNIFSSEEQVRKSYDFINNIEKPACPGCARGVRMCKHTPCIGTVEDIRRIMDAGYSKALMLDYWTGTGDLEARMSGAFGLKNLPKSDRDNPFNEDVLYLTPAIIGYGGRQTPYTKSGTCSFLKNDLCSLHDKGLKPSQGRFACCSVERVYRTEDNKKRDIDERIPILHTWNTQEGQDLIERWKKEIDYQPDRENFAPESLEEMFSVLIDVLSSKLEMYEQAEKDPDYDERLRNVKVIELQRPY